jgi:hypothetical protein
MCLRAFEKRLVCFYLYQERTNHTHTRTPSKSKTRISTCGVGAWRRWGRGSVKQIRRGAARLLIVRLLGAPPRAIHDNFGYLSFLVFLKLATFGCSTLSYVWSPLGLPLVLALVLGIFWNIIGRGISGLVLRNGSLSEPRWPTF